MFSGKQFGVLGLISGANLLLSLLISTIGGSLGAQGPTGQTGPQGPQGSEGTIGEAGEDGRPVEFQVEDNVLQWRYLGEATWNALDLEITGGGSSTINFGGSEGFFSHWVFGVNPNFQFDYSEATEITNAATYAQNLIANQGYLGVATVEELEAIGDGEEELGLNYVLTSDIDLAGWLPSYGRNVIRNEYGSFRGTLDGAGFTISNYSISDTSFSQSNDIGLFYELRGANIRNLNLVDFSVNLTGGSENVGALTARVDTFDSRYTVLDQVSLNGFEIISTDYLTNVGGLVGQIDEGIQIVRSNSANMTVATDSSLNAVGGMFGYMDSSSELELYEVNSQLEVIQNDPETTYNNDRIGGVGGHVEYNATIIAYKVNSQFVGGVDESSSAFIGQIEDDSKVILKEMTVNADISRSNGNSGYSTGGLLGYLGEYGLLFADDIDVTGDIRGYEKVGGFIGNSNEGSVIKITNSTMLADLEGVDDVGGFVGYLDSNNHRWMFENNTINTTITVPQDAGNLTSIYASAFGGVIGFIDERDGDVEYTNQIILENMDVTVNFAFDILDFEQLSSANFSFNQMGGMFGEIDYDNQIRVINSTVDASFDFTVKDISKFEYTYLNVNEIGGVAGYITESTLLLANVESTLEFNVLVENFTPETTNNEYFYNYIYSIGGAVGESNDSNIIILEGSYDLSLIQNVTNISSPNYNYDFEVYSVGALVGDLDDSLVLGELFDTSLVFDVTIDDITLGDGNRLDIEIYDVGDIFGDTNGSVAFIEDVTMIATATADVQEELENVVTVSVTDLTKPTGDSNPFIVIS